MRLLKTHVLLRLINSYIVDSPQPANISYLWNFGSLLGVCLVLQILTGVFLAMHYQAHVDFAFNSVEHIMRDVNNGWAIRYTHANVASFFFIFVYAHIARGLYYSSYKSPRVLVWTIGVIILILMMAIGFLGYVLPYGQMSLWGYQSLAQNIYIINYFYYNQLECLSLEAFDFYFNFPLSDFLLFSTPIIKINKINHVKANLRIGPHNLDILSIIFGSLLGEAHAERRVKDNGTRICLYQEGYHLSYLIWLHKLITNLGYCNPILPKLETRLGFKGRVRKIIRFKTWTYSSLN